MIYVCEYDGSLDAQTLQHISEQLPLTFPEGWQSGNKWEKARQRILAWLLLAYGMKQIGFGVNQQTPGKKHVIEENQQLCRGIGEIFQKLAIMRDEHGKPYSSAHPEIKFNLSHCDTACACIVGWADAGVDIERKFAYRASLARKVCHPREAEILGRLDQEECQRQLRLLWSLKESFVKLDGRGLGYGMDRIDLSGFLPIKVSGIYDKEETAFRDSGIYNKEETAFRGSGMYNKEETAFRIAEYDAYTLAACSKDDRILDVKCISEQELLEKIEGEERL